MDRTARQRHSFGLGAIGLGVLVLMAGCANIFGIEDWEDPPFASTSAETSASSSSASSGGGTGGTNAVHNHCSDGDGGDGQGGAGGQENPTCADCVQNGSETDVDCGGDACGPCPLGATCLNDADCESGGCPAGVCAAPPPPCNGGQGGAGGQENPTCADCVKNGPETDVDCGGDSCPPCLRGKSCVTAADCESGVCLASGCE
jgi:hypothetical protein